MEALRRSLTPELVVVFGYDTGLPDGVTRVVATTDAFVHTDYGAGAFLHDLGLVQLAEEVVDVPTLPLEADAPTLCAVGDALRLVGWGAPGDDDHDLTVKRTAEVPLFDHDATMLYAYDSDAGPNACVGDSGGAVLRQRADGSVALAGLIAYVSDDDDTPCAGGYTAATRLDVHRDWVEAWTGPLPRPAAEGWPEGACLQGASGNATCAAGAERAGVLGALLALAAVLRRRVNPSGTPDRAPRGRRR